MKIYSMNHIQAFSVLGERRTRHGFTLVELLVVIAIIVVLAATSFTMVGKMLEKAKESVCVEISSKWAHPLSCIIRSSTISHF